jgi:hypothetical protein
MRQAELTSFRLNLPPPLVRSETAFPARPLHPNFRAVAGAEARPKSRSIAVATGGRTADLPHVIVGETPMVTATPPAQLGTSFHRREFGGPGEPGALKGVAATPDLCLNKFGGMTRRTGGVHDVLTNAAYRARPAPRNPTGRQ